ncbi:hypothetical protein NG726_11820 [Pseudomonas sp. MOB-449]|nr:hypothetical protein [Pseudomonas sp. MOB-449]
MDRAPRHHAMVDFQQHQERKWCVLEEDHEKVEKRAELLEGLLRAAWPMLNGATDDFHSRVQEALLADPTQAKNAQVADTPSEDGPEVVGYRVEWKTNPKGSVRRTLAEQKPTIQLLELDYPKCELIGYEELMTVAQHERIVAAKDAEIAQLRGLTPDLPPRPPEGFGLPRYGLRWNGPGQPLSVPFDDGYWTPWHLAQTDIEALRMDAGRYRFLRVRIAASQLSVLGAECSSNTVEGVDAGIDAAILAQQGQEVGNG